MADIDTAEHADIVDDVVLTRDETLILKQLAGELLAKRARTTRAAEITAGSLRAMNEPPKYVAPYVAPPDGRTARVIDARRVMGWRREKGSTEMVPIYADD